MANQPSKPVRINVPSTGVSGKVQVEYESNSSNSSAARVLAIYVNDKMIDPNSANATTIVNNANTKTALNASLKQSNPTLAKQYSENVTPSYTGNKDKIYQTYQTSQNATSTVPPNAAGVPPSKTFKELTESVTGFNGQTLVYPDDLLSKDSIGQEYLQITAVQYQPPNKGQFGGTLAGGGSGIGALGKSGLFSLYSNITQKELSIKDNKGVVIFPMPATVADVNGVNWGESYLNPLGAAALGAASDAVGAVQNLFTGNVFQSGTNPLDQFGAGIDAATNPDLYEYGKSYAITKAVQQFVNVGDENEFLARTTGSITNPNAELLFKGPRLREYSFSYRLTPRSRSEAKKIRKIIRFFKINMLARRSSFLLNTPSIFFLEYKQRNGESIRSLNKFKPCALTTLNIDNSAGPFWNAYYDEDDLSNPQPISTVIQLKFQELSPVFADNYSEDGLNEEDNVGY